MKAVLLSSLVMLAVASSAAVAQSVIPKGWFLHDDLSPTLTLAYYDPASGDVDVSLNCTAGYSDVVVAFYPKSGDMSEGRSAKLELRNGDATHSIDATGKTYNGRYVFDGLTTMEPALGKLLVGGFTMLVGGEEMGTYTPNENDGAHVRKLAEACTG
ncbi:hypothetical protein WHT83_20260 [Aminobacter sp. P9b]|uniref:hypothetical protein n=1 Tax=Aminobacter sp. P9b TaxID=3133697 RepID=UPI0032457C02